MKTERFIIPYENWTFWNS